MKSWYLVTTKTNEEAKAESNLLCQGYDAYSPKLKIKSENSNRPWELIPAFPRYCFVQFDPTIQSASTINSTFGVSKLVTFGDVLIKVSDTIIEHLKSRIDGIGITKNPNAAFNEGDRVDILDGPFSGADAIFQEPNGLRRSLLLVTMLGKEHCVTLKNKSFA